MTENKEYLDLLYRGGKTKRLVDNRLLFQAISWEKEDKANELEESDSEYNYSAFDDRDVSSAPRKRYPQKNFLIHVFGVTEDGTTVSLDIEGFRPYFFLKIPKTWGPSQVRLLSQKIRNMVPKWRKDDIVVDKKVSIHKDFYEFDNFEDHAFLRIAFKTESSRWDMRKALNDEEFNMTDDPTDVRPMMTKVIRLMGGAKYRFPIYEASVDSIIRFIDISGVKPTGWIQINRSALRPARQKTQCQLSYSVRWEYVKPSDKEDIAPFRVTSFDIECTSCDGSFPQAKRRSDAVIQIGSTTRTFGSKYCQIRHIVCLKKCDPLPDIKHESDGNELVITESYPTERQVLIAWTRHIQQIDPDIVIGYNILGFDWKYLYDRAEMLHCVPQFSRLGRITGSDCKLVNKQLSSSAMGQNFLHYPDMKGRVQIDLLKVVQREHNLSSYKLDNVANKFLNLRKNDLPPNQIFARYKNGSPEDIRIIAEYCLQDCVLVNDLFDKLNILSNAVGMSNVCYVPMTLLFFRGQGIKVFSLMAKTCREANHRFPTLKRLAFGSNTGVGYEGAIVFDPTPGMYFKPVAVLDYKSLYPSSEIEFNISHEMKVTDKRYMNLPGYRYNEITYDVKNDKQEKIGEQTDIYAERLPTTPEEEQDPGLCKGIVPRLLIKLLDARTKAKKLKKKAKGTFMESVYDGLQLAYKITCNSVYGYFGAKFSDLRWQSLAASTTAVGRLRLHYAEEKAEEYPGVKVVYGDTDSIFIDCSQHESVKGKEGKEALKATIRLGEIIAESITKTLRYPHVLEYEKTFWPFFIIKKKKYRGHLYETNINKYVDKSMGLVTKRRDNAPIVKNIYNGVIDILFKDRNIDKSVKFYRDAVKELLHGNVSIEDLVITKTLKSGYKTPTQITHKVLAEKIADRDPGNAPASNERIPYVFIDEKELICRKNKCRKIVNTDKCKCISCMYLFCFDHLRRRSHECEPRCRICWTRLKTSECNICKGSYCAKHRSKHKCSKIHQKVTQGDRVETPSYIQENGIRIDYRYYLDHQVMKPIQQIFNIIEETKGINLLQNLLVRDNNRRSGNRSITDFF